MNNTLLTEDDLFSDAMLWIAWFFNAGERRVNVVMANLRSAGLPDHIIDEAIDVWQGRSED